MQALNIRVSDDDKDTAISVQANGNKGFVKETRRSVVVGKRTFVIPSLSILSTSLNTSCC